LLALSQNGYNKSEARQLYFNQDAERDAFFEWGALVYIPFMNLQKVK
jgi:hypothetical protein